MSGPVATYIELPDDTVYTGKTKDVRMQSRVVGANTVHEHVFQYSHDVNVIGVFQLMAAQLTVSGASQDGVTSGFLWLYMPSTITNRSARFRRAWVTSELSSTGIMSSSPRVTLARFTYTGTPTGTPVIPAFNDPRSIPPQLEIVSTSAGWSASLGAALGSAPILGNLTAAEAYECQVASEYEIFSDYADEDEWLILAPGEGAVFYQDVAGTTSDTRKLNIGVTWDEIDTGP